MMASISLFHYVFVFLVLAQGRTITAFSINHDGHSRTVSSSPTVVDGGRLLPLSSSTTSKTRTTTLGRYAFFASSSMEGQERDDTSATTATTPPPPMFNGKRVLPGSIVLAGLRASSAASGRVLAVYAIYASKGSNNDDWAVTMHVGATQDLYSTLLSWESKVGKVDRIRALSFTSSTSPQLSISMLQIVQDWKQQAQDAGAVLMDWIDPSPYLNDEDDDEDDEDDWDVEMTAQAMATVGGTTMDSGDSGAGDAIISPFASKETVDVESSNIKDEDPADLPSPFTVESVDRVLDEVRPYLVADGGNVAVVNVLVDKNNDEGKVIRRKVQLELQGACGSCPSSTVTMQMGIERVLKEKFGPSVMVEQVTTSTAATGADGDGGGTFYRSLVEEELNRIMPAITAMGGTCNIVNIDEEVGHVQLFYTGPERVKQGLELALRDVIPSVEFVDQTN